MIDVFFCTFHDGSQIRLDMATLCKFRWSCENVNWTGWASTSKDFQRGRRVDADAESKSDIYVVADDDCLPGPDPFVEEAVKVMEKHSDFGILSLWPTNCNIVPWTSKDGDVFEDDDVMEHVSVGLIRFCRNGVLKEFPPQTGKGYDRTHCDAIREAGYRVGFFKNIKANHLGEGYTTVWK